MWFLPRTSWVKYMHSLRIFNEIKPTSYGLHRLLSSDSKQKDLPKHAEIVIAGGGAVGSSIAYHLVKCGCKDILLLEQGSAGCGTSWHAAGLCGTMRTTKSQVAISLYANNLFEKLEEETGVSTGFRKCGSIYVAKTKDRAYHLRRTAVRASQHGVESYVVSPKEAGELNPLMNYEDIELAMWVPNDGTINPTDLIQAYLKGARKNGATKFIDGVQVTSLQSNGKFITTVNTDFGSISCDKFVNAAGLWARDLGLKSTPAVQIPLHACEHFYIITKPLENVSPMLPVTRDYDAQTYLREWSGGLLGGGFEPDAKGVFYNGFPENSQFMLLEEDWDQFGFLMDGLMHRYPVFNTAEIHTFMNGPESFTMDGVPYVSKSIEFSNYYVATGMSSLGIRTSAGAGKCIAELITYGESSIDINSLDIRRIPPGSNNKLLCHDNAARTLSNTYVLSYPKMNSDSNCNIMNSPIHWLLDKKGAVWGQFANWERPYYFKKSDDEKHSHSFGQPSWLSNVQSELKSCEESVGIFDLSSKSKFNVTCDDSGALIKFLESTCLYDGFNQMKQGSVVETAVHDTKMSLVSTVDIFKVNENKYTMVTWPNQHTFLLSHLQDSVEENVSNIDIEDITGKYASLGLVGPKSEELLNDLLSPPFVTSNVQQGECHPVDIGYASRVQLARHFMNRINGWQLFIPTEYSQGLYGMMMRIGEKHNIGNAGYIALDSLRISHMIPFYNSEIGPGTASGILRKIYKDENNDINSLMLLEISMPNSNNWPWGGEPVLVDDQIIGNLSSVGFTKENDKLLALTFLNSNAVALKTSVSVVVGDDQYNAKVINC